MTRFRSASRLASAGRHCALLFLVLFATLPILWMIVLSVRSPEEMFTGGLRLWPHTFYGRTNYLQALTKEPLLRFIWNGIIVCFSIIFLQIITAAPCAYALAKLRFVGRGLLFAMVIVTLAIPNQVLAIPLFLIFNRLHLLNTYAGLILPFAISPFGIFILRQRFKAIPDDLLDAARLDGLGEVAILWRVMLPLSIPSLTAFGIFSLITHWNDLFWPLIAIRTNVLATPPLGIVVFRNVEAGDAYGPLMAGAAMIVTPLIAAFLLAQRRFVEGATMGAVK